MMHLCGGTILGASHDGLEYSYCDTCGAFAHGDPDTVEVPDGTDAAANRAAYDDGDEESPWA